MPSTSLRNDLGAESLELVELVMEFEEEFGVHIPDDDAEKIESVADLIRFVRSRQAE